MWNGGEKRQEEMWNEGGERSGLWNEGGEEFCVEERDLCYLSTNLLSTFWAPKGKDRRGGLVYTCYKMDLFFFCMYLFMRVMSYYVY